MGVESIACFSLQPRGDETCRAIQVSIIWRYLALLARADGNSAAVFNSRRFKPVLSAFKNAILNNRKQFGVAA